MRGILSTMPPDTPPATPTATPLTDAQFHQLAHAVLAAVESTVDRWLDDDVIDIDSQRTGGLLELSLPGGSKIILNTQPPLHEIWLAARAGGHHYRYVQGRWLDTRDGSEFFAALSQHASTQAGKGLMFAAPTPT
jgi:CyaY protein